VLYAVDGGVANDDSQPLHITACCMTYRKSLDLIDILLQLADEGFQALVLELFKFPMQYCPDLLLLGLLQIV